MQLSQFTQDMANHLFPGQRTYQDAILGLSGSAEDETISAAGALTPSVPVSYLSVSGTKAYTLADGSYSGQRKRIQCIAAASTPAGTLTIATPDATAGFVTSATYFFDTVGQMVELMWVAGAGWRAVNVQRAGTSGVLVVGTTVVQASNLWGFLNFSVTATVDSQSTKGIANGTAIGELLTIGTSVAATSPIGTIACTCRGMDGVLSTAGAGKGVRLNSATLLENGATLRWDGALWQIVSCGAGVQAL